MAPPPGPARETLVNFESFVEALEQKIIGTYHNWESFEAELMKLPRESRTSNGGVPVDVIPNWFDLGSGVIARTVEGRKVYAFRAGNFSASAAVYVQAGIHAREWLSPSGALAILHLLSRPTLRRDLPEVAAVLDKCVLYVTPMVNPDGFEYSVTTDRMWRKNRASNQPVSSCIGVDLNRNFESHFGYSWSSSDPCDFMYRGTSPWSEEETKGVRNFIHQVLSRHYLGGSLDFHTYGQLILRQPGWTPGIPPFVKEETQAYQQLVGTRMSDTIRALGGPHYGVQSGQSMYPVGGSADGWMYTQTEGDHHLSFAVELRPCFDCNRICFSPPASFIPGTVLDMYVMIHVMAQHAISAVEEQPSIAEALTLRRSLISSRGGSAAAALHAARHVASRRSARRM